MLSSLFDRHLDAIVAALEEAPFVEPRPTVLSSAIAQLALRME